MVSPHLRRTHGRIHDGGFRTGNEGPRLHFAGDGWQAAFRCARRWHAARSWQHFLRFPAPPASMLFPSCSAFIEAQGNEAVTIVGISQNAKKDTAAFIKEYGITFPVLLDDTTSYPVSNAYGLTNVPTIFWIAEDGEIEISSVGWVKKEMEEFNQRAQPAAHHSRCSTRTNRSPTSAPVEDRRTSPRSRAKSGAGFRATDPFPCHPERSRPIRERIGLWSRRTPIPTELCVGNFLRRDMRR